MPYTITIDVRHACDDINANVAIDDINDGIDDALCKIMSLNMQKKRCCHILHQRADVISVQEGTYANKLMLKQGHNLSSPNIRIRLWTKYRMNILKNYEYIQIVGIRLKEKKKS